MAGAAAAYTAKREVSAVVNNKVGKRIQKKYKRLEDWEKATAEKLAKRREKERSQHMQTADRMRLKHGLGGHSGPSGYLLKRGRINTAFKRRWFTLEAADNALYYSKEPGSEVLGIVPLSGAQISLLQAEGEEWEMHVQVMSGRTFVMRCEPPNPRARMEAWVTAMEAEMAREDLEAASLEEEGPSPSAE